MSGYAIVQFTEWGDGKSAEAVPVSWIVNVGNREMCYYLRIGVKKAVKTSSTPKGDWELHVVRRLSRKDISSYETALEKERKAMYTSGVDTDDGKSPVEPGSRKRKPPKRFRSDSDSESDHGDMGEPQFYYCRY